MTPIFSVSKSDYCARISQVEIREKCPQAITDAIILSLNLRKEPENWDSDFIASQENLYSQLFMDNR